ncbi:MAG: hypothetical protein IPH20_03895 [Bacteroidales bacterium]|nr:hypothetical protein [Bacteroidales bacterium]
MRNTLFILLLILNAQAMAQQTIEGEYFFSRQEMVAGFRFSSDGKFEFFYSYGAVDRNATGTFSVEGNMVKLKSDKSPGNDFVVTDQSKRPGGYHLKFEHPNQLLVENILCIFIKNGNQQKEYSDSKGEVFVKMHDCDTIYVQQSLYPDILTLIKDEKNTNNRFTLSLNPSLEQVSFKGIDLKIEDENTLTCLPNYFMGMEGIEFTSKK